MLPSLICFRYTQPPPTGDDEMQRTTIRFGAAHNGLVTTSGTGTPLEITFARASRVDKAEAAALICELHGIKDNTKRSGAAKSQRYTRVVRPTPAHRSKVMAALAMPTLIAALGA